MSIERVNPHGMAADDKVDTFHELALFLGGSEDSWTGDMLRLIAKSDPAHREALRVSVPIHVAVWTRWNDRVTEAPTVAELTAAAADA